MQIFTMLSFFLLGLIAASLPLPLFRELLAKAVPRKFRKGDVLHRVIAANLIVGSTVGRPQIKTFESRYVRRDSERNPDKPPRGLECSWPRRSRFLCLNRPVPKRGVRQHCDAVLVAFGLRLHRIGDSNRWF